MTAPPDTSPETGEFSPIRFQRLDLLLAAILLVLALSPAAPLLLRHLTILGAIEPGNCENLNEWVPFRRIITQSAARGYFPAWMPEFNSGTPLIGWPHTSRFAPLGIIYSLLPYNTAAVAGTYVHLAIFTLSLYYLLRLLSRRPAGSFLGCVLAMALWQIAEADHFLPRLFTFSWVPLLFACYVGIWRTRRMAYTGGAIIALGLQILGGNMETIGREYLTLGLVLAGITITSPRETLARGRELAIIALTMAAGIALGLIQFLPAYEYVHFCTRSDPQWFTYEAFSSTASLKLVMDYARVVLGAVVPTAVLMGLTELRRRQSVQVVLFTAVILTLLATNTFSALKLFYRLPFVGEMMWHQLNFFFVNILLAALAAQAADRIFEAGFRRRRVVLAAGACLAFGMFLRWENARIAVSDYQFPMDRAAAYQDRIYFLYLGLAAAGFAIAAAGARARNAALVWLVAVFMVEGFLPSFQIMHRQKGPFPDFNPAYLEYFSRPHPPARSMALAPASRFNRRSIPYQLGILPGEQTTDSFMTSSVRWYAEFYMLLIGPGPDGNYPRLTFQQIKNRPYVSDRNLHLLNLMNVAYLIAEETNLKFSSHYFPAYYWTPASCRARSCRRTGLDGTSPAGVAVSPPGSWGQTIFVPPGASLRFGLRPEADGQSASAFFQVRIKSEERTGGRLLFARTFAGPEWDRAGSGRLIGLSEFAGQSADLQFDLLPGPDHAPGSAIEIANPAVINPHAVFKRADLAGVNIFVNSGALSRAFAVHDYKVLADPAERLAFIGGRAFDPGSLAVLEVELAEPVRRPRFAGSEKIEVVSYEADRVTVSATLAEPGLVLLSDVYYPGWRADVDGTEQKIHRADHAFRAVALDAGRRSLVFSFRPLSLEIGIWVSTTAGICVIMFALIFAVRAGRSRRPG